MSVASVKTKLPLATWAKYMGLNPLHFEQVVIDTDPHCSRVYFQNEWQAADHVSREEIARAIAEAEAKIEDALGYHLAPDWEVDEWRDTIRPHSPEYVFNNYSDVRGFRQTAKAKWGYFISGGICSKSLIEADSTITFTDPDLDNYFEKATVTVNTSAVNPEEIAIYYPGHDGEDEWEIRPTQVSIALGVATIVFRRELVVKEELLNTLAMGLDQDSAAAANGYDDDDFLAGVDVYRKYNDPQTQVSMLWEPLAIGCTVCGGSGCSTCAYSIQAGCLTVRGDPRQSIVGYFPADWNSDDLVFDSTTWITSRQPDIVRLYYYSGWRNKGQRYTNRMDPAWERTVAYMAAAMLDRPPCDCAADVWMRYRQDLTLVSGDEDGKPYYRQPAGILDNPFGSRRGEVDAWRKVGQNIIASAAAL